MGQGVSRRALHPGSLFIGGRRDSGSAFRLRDKGRGKNLRAKGARAAGMVVRAAPCSACRARLWPSSPASSFSRRRPISLRTYSSRVL
jgi:hypothetical protein